MKRSGILACGILAWVGGCAAPVADQAPEPVRDAAIAFAVRQDAIKPLLRAPYYDGRVSLTFWRLDNDGTVIFRNGEAERAVAGCADGDIAPCEKPLYFRIEGIPAGYYTLARFNSAFGGAQLAATPGLSLNSPSLMLGPCKGDDYRKGGGATWRAETGATTFIGTLMVPRTPYEAIRIVPAQDADLALFRAELARIAAAPQRVVVAPPVPALMPAPTENVCRGSQVNPDRATGSPVGLSFH